MDRGRILLEVFGDARVNPLLEREPGLERGIYERAIDLLAELHRSPPGNVPAYEAAVPHREAGLLTEWYAPALGVAVDAAAFATAWEEALGDRKSVGEGKSVSVRVDLGGRRFIKKKKI